MTLSGTVVRGEGLGRKLGFATANLRLDGGLTPSAKGVWTVMVEGESLPATRAVCNIGFRPSVTSAGVLAVEVHIPSFSGDLYGQRLKLTFIRKLRDEKKFSSLEELKAQIARDVADMLSTNRIIYNSSMAEKETINQDGNLLGRLGALAVIVAAVLGLCRLCGMGGYCPFSSGRPCCATQNVLSK